MRCSVIRGECNSRAFSITQVHWLFSSSIGSTTTHLWSRTHNMCTLNPVTPFLTLFDSLSPPLSLSWVAERAKYLHLALLLGTEACSSSRNIIFHLYLILIQFPHPFCLCAWMLYSLLALLYGMVLGILSFLAP